MTMLPKNLDPYDRPNDNEMTFVSIRTNEYAISVTEHQLHDVDSLNRLIKQGYTHGIWYEEYGTKASRYFVSNVEKTRLQKYWNTANYGYVMIKPLTVWMGWAENEKNR